MMNFLCVALIVLLGFGIYANSLSNGFVYDDELVVKDNNFLSSWGNLKYFFSPLYLSGSGEYNYRPVLTLSYVNDYIAGNGSPFRFHLTNVLLHVCNGALLYYLLLSILPLCGTAGYPVRLLALLSSLFFIAHPIQTEVVNGIAFREEELILFFSLFSLFFYLKMRQRFKFFLYSVSLGCFLLALFSKITSIVFIPVLIMFELMRARSAGEKNTRFLEFAGRILRYISGYFAVLVVFLYVRLICIVSSQATMSALKGTDYPGGSLYTAVLTTSRIFMHYLWLLVFPVRLSIENYYQYILNPSTRLWEPAVLISCAVIVAIGVFIAVSLKKKPVYAFAGVWFFFWMLPAANILPLNHPMAERYLYSASPGFFLFISVLLMDAYRGMAAIISAQTARRVGVFFVIGIISVYSMRTIMRNRSWSNGLAFWTAAAQYSPVSQRAHTGLGFAYFEKKMYEKASKEYNTAIKISPDYPDSYHDLGKLYFEKGMYQEAENCFVSAIQKDRKFVKAYNDLGRLYLVLKQYDKAEAVFSKAIEINPLLENAHNNLGKLYFLQGDYDRSIMEYQKALQIAPRSEVILLNIGITYYSKGDFVKAEQAWARSVAIKPDFLEAHINLGILYVQMGADDKAKAQWLTVLSLDPSNSAARKSLELLEERI